MRVLTWIAVVAVAAILGFVAFAGFLAPTIPDANSPIGMNGEQNVGYFDVKYEVLFYLANGECVENDSAGRCTSEVGGGQVNAQGRSLLVDEFVTAPGGPVRDEWGFLSATAGDLSCHAFVRMFVNGPGVSIQLDTAQVKVPRMGTSIFFKWGHVYAFELGATYDLVLETFMVMKKGECGSNGGTVMADSSHQTFVFDGVDYNSG